jgi:hypothetical protein
VERKTITRKTVERIDKKFTISGSIKIEDKSQSKENLSMNVYARVGKRTIASCSVNKNRKFALKFERRQNLPPATMELLVGPPINEDRLTKTNTKQISIASKEWKVEGNNFSIEKEIILPDDIILCMLPRDIKICGIVCKDMAIEGSEETICCPVPYAKVEIYDVDPLIFKLESSYKGEIVKEVAKTPITSTMDISKLALADGINKSSI